MPSYGRPRDRGEPVSAVTDGVEWQMRAACRGPQSVVFFPPTVAEAKDERSERERRAKAICAQCSVITECLEYALRIREPHGIWGGLNEQERRRLL